MADKLTTMANLQDFYTHHVGVTTVEAFSIDRGPRGDMCFFGYYDYFVGGNEIEVRFDGATVESTRELLDWLDDKSDEITEDVNIAGLNILLHGNKFTEAEIRGLVNRLIVATHEANSEIAIEQSKELLNKSIANIYKK